jgi:glycosyltransferase involved in cell wall biosynthesis
VTRICHITTAHPPGDARILHKECASLRAAGYDVTLVAPHHEDTVIDGIRVVALRARPGRRLVRMALRPYAAYRAALAADADAYHFHDPDFLPYAVRLRRLGRPVIYDAHEDYPVQILSKDWLPSRARRPAAWGFERLERASIARLDAVVAVDDPIRARLARHQPRAVVVANYPRLEEIAPAASWAERSRTACYVGGITPLRGARELVDAMAHVDAHLLLAGPMSPPSLRAELEASPGWSRVRYLGTLGRAEIARLLAGARVGVIPLHPVRNYADAYPVKLFEYMAAGLPVVATDVPRWREVLDTHDCGVVVPPRSPERLAAAIRGLLDDEPRARAMGERGRRAAVERYSWETQAGALLALYEGLLG